MMVAMPQPTDHLDPETESFDLAMADMITPLSHAALYVGLDDHLYCAAVTVPSVTDFEDLLRDVADDVLEDRPGAESLRATVGEAAEWRAVEYVLAGISQIDSVGRLEGRGLVDYELVVNNVARFALSCLDSKHMLISRPTVTTPRAYAAHHGAVRSQSRLNVVDGVVPFRVDDRLYVPFVVPGNWALDVEVWTGSFGGGQDGR